MLKVKVDDRALLEALEKAAARTRDTAPLMREIAGIMHGEVERNFDAEGRPRWKDLYPATKKKRAKTGHWPGKMLQVSGHLVGSITASSDESMAVVGTNVVYAPIHHFGGTIQQPPRSNLYAMNRGKKGRFEQGKRALSKGASGFTSGRRVIDIPARPFLTLPDSGVQKVIRAVERFLAG